MHAFGRPGIDPTWTSSAKDLVGCALGSARLWFTSGFGIIDEIYYPRIDIPQVRDLGFIVADDRGFWVEVKRLNSNVVRVPGAGIPALEITHAHARFLLRLRVVPDPDRDVLLVSVALEGDDTLRPYALLAPHLGGNGRENCAQATVHRGRKVLWAEQGPFALALAAVDDHQRDALGGVSAGFVGASDGWQDFCRNGRLTWNFECAGPGNVALIGELTRSATIALGFGSSRTSAATLALSSLYQSFDDVCRRHVASWRDWHGKHRLASDLSDALRDQLAISAMVLRVHQDKTFPGAMVASLSIPWGNASDDAGGYHLVWPRDLVESAGGLLAIGAVEDARNVLRYLIATQLPDGNWPQNQWLGGKAFWQGVQLDEAAFPVLLAAAIAERDGLDGIDVASMVRRALAFIARSGPSTEQDRWEEDAGLNAFTLATCIAALVCGSRWLDEPSRTCAESLADDWNSRIEEWTSVRDTTLARAHGVSGYYVRIAPPAEPGDAGRLARILAIRNRRCDPGIPADAQVCTDFLQLVRMGLRDARDPLVLDTITVIDGELKVDTPSGPAWHRYTGDGYGEKVDGRPFDGTGRGRAWPLLAGERGHYEVAAGRGALPYLETMCAMTGRCGLIPEQVWDTDALPEKGLAPGKPTGSAMPLVWAHAEFVKLAASHALRRPFDRPDAVWRRYGGRRPDPPLAIWTHRTPIERIRAGQRLLLLLPRPARVHFGFDGWARVDDIDSRDGGLTLHAVELPTAALAVNTRIDFTMLWTDTGQWEGHDYHLDVR